MMNTITLMYHRLYSTDNKKALEFSKFYQKRSTVVSVDSLVSDISYLRDKGWKHVPIEDIVLDNSKTFHISFDDGYKEMINLAIPTLLDLGINDASFYITTSTLGEDFVPLPLDVLYYLIERDRLSEVITLLNLQLKEDVDKAYPVIRERLYKMSMGEILGFYKDLNLSTDDIKNIRSQYLNIEDIKNISSHGFTIGTHGSVHRDYCLYMSESETELADSLTTLKSVTGDIIKSFAFPDGIYNHQLIEICNKLGLTYLLAISKNNTDDKVIPRKFITSKGVKEYV